MPKQTFKDFFDELGEDPDRAGLRDTPERFFAGLRENCSGYGTTLASITKDSLYSAQSDGLVLTGNIEFYSLCEHHLLPFSGICHVGYYPQSQIIGLGRLNKIVEALSKRLQMQERLTRQIADWVEKALSPAGVGVVMEAHHFCMTMRGAKSTGRVVSSQWRGVLREQSYKDEFLTLVRTRRPQ